MIDIHLNCELFLHMSILLASSLQRQAVKNHLSINSLFFSIITCLPRSHKESQSSKYNPAIHSQMYAKYQPKQTCFLQTVFVIYYTPLVRGRMQTPCQEALFGCRLHKRSQYRQVLPQNRIRIRQNDGEAVPRWRTAECPGLLHYLVCFLCFLAAETGPGDGAWNSLPETSLHFSSFLYLLRASVRVLWVLTDFWSPVGTPTDADHQLSNARLFDKSHY